MKRTVYNNRQKMQAYSVALQRLNLSGALGREYNGARDLYTALGYSKVLAYADYYAKYKRNGVASAVINKPIDVTWRGELHMITEGDEESAIINEWDSLYKEHGLKSIFNRIDKLAALGGYAILLMGYDDTTTIEAFNTEPTGARKLIYVKPFSKDQATIASYVTTPQDPRFGKPLAYNIQINESQAVLVHYSRVVHITAPILDDELCGLPAMEKVFNNLQDLEKVVGGSGEMFWRGARPGYQGVTDDKFELGPTMADDLKEQLDEYENNLRRVLVNEGIKMEALETQVSDPTAHADVQYTMISTGTNIPKRILLGSERGELASSQDEKNWYAYIQSRREEYAETHILNLFVETCQQYKILPLAPNDNAYEWLWSDLMSVSDKEKVEVGKGRAEALSKYASSANAESIVPPEQFFRFFLGLNDMEVDILMEAYDKLDAGLGDGELNQLEQEVIEADIIVEEEEGAE